MGKERTRSEFAHKVRQLVDKLPLFPEDVDRLLAAAVKPNQNNAEILRLIQRDPALCNELLELLSPYYATAERIEAVEDAVDRVGTQPLIQLIGVLYARDSIRKELASLKYIHEYLDHSEDISVGCHILADIAGTPRAKREMYTVAGLMHDIGRLVIRTAGNQTSAHLLGTLWGKMTSVIAEENTVFGTDHCDVGAQICRRWNFSPIIQEGVLRHHTPLVDNDFSLPGALIFISHFLSASDPSGEILSTLSVAKVVAELKISEADFDEAKEIYKAQNHNSKLRIKD